MRASLRGSLRARTTAVAVGLGLLALGSSGVVAALTLADAVRDTTATTLTARADHLARLAVTPLRVNDRLALRDLPAAAADAETGVAVFDARAAPLTGDAVAGPEVTAALQAAPDSVQTAERDGRLYVARAVHSADGALLGVVRVDAAPDPAGAAGHGRQTMVVALLAVAAGLGLLAMAASQWALRPLVRLTHAVRRTTRADAIRADATRADAAAAVGPLRTDGPAEVRDLAAAFNTLTTTLQRQAVAVAEERRRLEEILAATADVVMAVDREARIVYANPAARRRFQFIPAPDAPPPFLSVLPDYEVYQLLRRALAGAGADSTLVRRDQQQFQVTAQRLSAVGDWSATVVMHDVTALHAAEAARRELIADVSHELRTPIASMIAAVETLELGVGPDDAPRFHHIIHTEADQMAHLVEEMLNLARLESGLAEPQIQPVDLRWIVEDAVERIRPQAERAGLTLHAVDPGEFADLMVHADPDLITRALLNLLQNALKFTPAPGDLHVHARPEGALVWVLVQDTGIGLSAEDQARVFQRFYRADRARRRGEGTGLGLALVRHIAELHGGGVRVISAPGQGSTFGFSLPRVER